MVQIEFTIYDDHTASGYRTITHTEPSLELAIDYMHKYHIRATAWYHYTIDNKRYGKVDPIGVLGV